MLKTFIIAAGTFLAATTIAYSSADASTFRSHRLHRGITIHKVHANLPRARGRAFARLRQRGGGLHRVHDARVRVPRGAHGSHRLALAHRAYGRHARRLAAGRDEAIRRYVGPASGYERASAPVGGAQIGGASYYGGRSRTASGGSVGAATCAHRSLPFGTRVLVTNLANARRAVLTVNDRGPFVRGRIVDVSVGAAGTLGMLHSGTARVSIQVVGGPG